jgi:hypothetical protein
LVLRRAARIRGEVLASGTGHTISGREVELSPMTEGEYQSVNTDPRGQFVFENVSPGEYTVMLEASPEELRALALPDTDPELDWELAQALSRSAKVSVEEGAEAHVVFGAQEQGQVRIQGLVRRGLEPAAHMRISARRVEAADDRASVHALSDANGRFELSVAAAGSYRLQVLAGGSLGMPTAVEIQVPAAGVQDVKIAISSGRIAGRLHARSTADSGYLQLALEREGGGRAMLDSEGDKWPNWDFAFENLPAGTYTLSANSWVATKNGESYRLLAPLRRTIVLAADQQLEGLLLEVDDR